MKDEINFFKTFKKPIGIGILIFILFIVLLLINPTEVINSTERGLLTTFGKVSDKILDPGLQFKTPFIQDIEKISIQPKQLDYAIEVGKDGAITKDNQTIGATLTVFYKYKLDRLSELYKNYGEDKIKSILANNIKETFKSIIGEYTIFIIPTNQEEIRAKTFASLKSKMENYPLEVTEFKIINYDWSDEFDKQIQTTMQKAQEVKQKEQELLITELEAQKKVKQAEADKESVIKVAEGEKESARLQAEAKVLEGEGIRKYNEQIRQTLDIEITFRKLEIEKIRAERWNGKQVADNWYAPIPIDKGTNIIQ